MRFTLPSSALGGLISDIAGMRGEIVSTRALDELISVVALIPASTSMRYGERFAQLTGGRGVMIAQLDGYRECALSDGATCLAVRSTRWTLQSTYSPRARRWMAAYGTQAAGERGMHLRRTLN